MRTAASVAGAACAVAVALSAAGALSEAVQAVTVRATVAAATNGGRRTGRFSLLRVTRPRADLTQTPAERREI